MDSGSNRNVVYEDFNFYATQEKLILQPIQNEDEVLVIDRVSRSITLGASRSHIPANASSKRVAGILGIINLLAGPYLILITSKVKVGEVNGQTIWKIASFESVPYSRTFFHLTDEQNLVNRQYLSMVHHALNQPNFYFSTTYDLMHTLQRLHNTSPDFLKMPLFERADVRFVWNKHLMRDLLFQPELSSYWIPVLLGFVSINTVNLSGRTANLVLISRRSVNRAGTRMFVRGVDGEGHVANFVETEQILEWGDNCSSFVITRGSIPLHWSQLPNLKYKPPPLLSSSYNQLEAFQKHFQNQLYNYGKQVIVNLVNHHGSEGNLEKNFSETCRRLNNPNVRYEAFDFHRECGTTKWERLSILMDRLAPDLKELKHFMLLHEHQCVSTQDGVFRVNCIDCLDRTNVVQTMLAKSSLENQMLKLRLLSEGQKISDFPQFEKVFKNVWADNGDMCSIQYAGTGALKSDYTRTGKRTVYGMMKDGVLSLCRYYKNNFADGFRQDSIDLILGNYQVQESEALSTPSPLTEKKDWRFIMLPIILLVATAMCFLSILIPAVMTVEAAFYFLFWAGMVMVSLTVIFYYGVEFVDYPRLRHIRNRLHHD